MKLPRIGAALSVAAVVVFGTAGCAVGAGDPAAVPHGLQHPPRPDHIVIVVEENHAYDQSRTQPYLSSLAATGATMTASYGITHPSEPNYLALWSGSTQGLTDDSCPHDYGARASLGSQLQKSGRTAKSYFDAIPNAGYPGCRSGAYARKHNPLADFAATANATSVLGMDAWPSGDYSTLATVSLVVPNLDHDMHDGSVATGDTWLKDHLSGYATWARTHNSLLIVTFDEDNKDSGNHILTVITGQHVEAGVKSAQRITHYNVLHTIEHAYGLTQLGPAAAPITGIWK